MRQSGKTAAMHQVLVRKILDGVVVKVCRGAQTAPPASPTGFDVTRVDRDDVHGAASETLTLKSVTEARRRLYAAQDRWMKGAHRRRLPAAQPPQARPGARSAASERREPSESEDRTGQTAGRTDKE